MKKRFLLLAVLTICLAGFINAEVITVTNSGFTFIPNEIVINLGDTVNFNISSDHNVLEVSESAWNSNQANPNGGFVLGFGGGQLVFDTPGTFYYVCQPHASMGMKGIINVSVFTGLRSTEKDRLETLFSVYPNPASDQIVISIIVQERSNVIVDLIDITGRVVKNLINSNFEQGEYKENLSIDDLQFGKYFVHYKSGDKNLIEQLLIIK